MLVQEAEELVTIQDIQEAVGVTDRTIRSWTKKGLLPRPVKIGLGRARGTVSYYPLSTLETARYIWKLREAGKTQSLLKVLRTIGSSQLLGGLDDEGRPFLIYRPKSFQ